MARLFLYNSLLIAIILVAGCQVFYTPVDISYKNNMVDSGLAPIDSQVYFSYLPYKQSLDAEMNKVIGISDSELIKDKPESLLTNFLADLLLTKGVSYCSEKDLQFQPDVSYFNYGGIRSALPKGEIKTRNIFELMPFENEMVFIKLKGEDLQLFFNVIASKGGDSLGGVRFKIEEGSAKNIKISGRDFSVGNEYWLVTNDYIANGGDDMEMLKHTVKKVNTGKKIRDVIIEFISEKNSEGEMISAKLDGRISYE